MTDFVRKNKFMVHVAAEILCLVVLVTFLVKTHKGIYEHIKYLEQKLYQYESVLEKHDQLLNTLLNKKVSFKEPIKTTIPSSSPRPIPTSKSPPPAPPSLPSPPLPQRHTEIEDDVKITDITEDEEMDKEISDEVRKVLEESQ
jgi:hypothetical protein